MAEFHLTKVVHERLDRREDDCLGIAEQAFVVFELLELVGERLNLLHLVADYLDELRDLLRGVRDGLSVESRIVNDPFRSCGQGDAECHERWRRRNNYEIIFADWDNPVSTSEWNPTNFQIVGVDQVRAAELGICLFTFFSTHSDSAGSGTSFKNVEPASRRGRLRCRDPQIEWFSRGQRELF